MGARNIDDPVTDTVQIAHDLAPHELDQRKQTKVEPIGAKNARVDHAQVEEVATVIAQCAARRNVGAFQSHHTVTRNRYHGSDALRALPERGDIGVQDLEGVHAVLDERHVLRRASDVDRHIMKLDRTARHEPVVWAPPGWLFTIVRSLIRTLLDNDTAVSTPLSATSIVSPLPFPDTASPSAILSVLLRMKMPSPIAMTQGWSGHCGATHQVSPAKAFSAAVTGSV